MFKKFMFAVVPMLMMAGTTFAGDEVTDIDGALTIDVATIAVADANVIEVGLDIDVEQLAANAGTEEKTDAIEACFRRCGYSNYGWRGGWGGGCRSWHSPCYSSCYRSCYQPYYSYSCARPVYYSPCVYQPVCQYYWGCY